jgi:hypothetical protein
MAGGRDHVTAAVVGECLVHLNCSSILYFSLASFPGFFLLFSMFRCGLL